MLWENELFCLFARLNTIGLYVSTFNEEPNKTGQKFWTVDLTVLTFIKTWMLYGFEEGKQVQVIWNREVLFFTLNPWAFQLIIFDCSSNMLHQNIRCSKVFTNVYSYKLNHWINISTRVWTKFYFAYEDGQLVTNTRVQECWE